MTRGASLGPLRHVGFRYVLGARFSSLLGNAVAPIALAFAVLDLAPGSPTALGLVLASRTVPQLVFMLAGGVIADRFSRDRVLAVANAASFLTQGAAATLLLTGVAEVWQLTVIEALNGTAAAFTLPAYTGLTPQVVPRGELQQANSLGGLARYVAMIGGGSLGGVVVAFVGSGWALGFDALTFGVAAALLLRLRLPPAVARGGANVARELLVGWHEFTARRWVWIVVLAFTGIGMVMAGCWNTLGPVIADQTFGRAIWGGLVASQAAGMAIGALTLLRLRPRRPLVWGMLASCAEVPLFFVLGFDPRPGLLFVAAVLSGVGIAWFGVLWETALQQNIPPETLSRVASYDALGSFCAVPLGQMLVGPLAVAFGAGEVVMAGAALYLCIALFPLLDRSVRTLRRTDNAGAESAS